jgi:hypothetical protein
MYWPKLYVLLLTYAPDMESPRVNYARKTLTSALHAIGSYLGQVSVHIADDGSPSQHRNTLIEIAGGYPCVRGVTSTNAERRGYGHSYNLATQTIHIYEGSIVLVLEDDWEAEGDLRIEQHVRALLNEGVGCIRLGYLGATEELRGTVRWFADEPYLLFDPKSEERHVSAGHPRLETIEWQREVGPWDEHDPMGYPLNAGTVEWLWCGRPAARKRVAFPLCRGPFAHIGAVQAREDQR